MDNSATFTLSLQHPDIIGCLSKCFVSMISLTTSLAVSKTVDAMGTINVGSHCNQYLISPKVFSQIDGTNTAIIGN